MEDIINVHHVKIENESVRLHGDIYTNDYVKSWVIFAHGSGSSHTSARNIRVAKELVKSGHAVLLFDLLTPEEDQDQFKRFDIHFLSERLLLATDCLRKSSYYTPGTPYAFFGASTGAAAALQAASVIGDDHLLYSVISRGGRPDLVDRKVLSSLFVPTLLIVGAEDYDVVELNKIAASWLLNCQIALVPHATHLFSEPGTLEHVTVLAANWLDDHVHIRTNEQTYSRQERVDRML